MKLDDMSGKTFPLLIDRSIRRSSDTESWSPKRAVQKVSAAGFGRPLGSGHTVVGKADSTTS